MLPGRYQLDPSCAPAAGLVTLGTVSPDGLGTTGSGAEGALEVYGTRDDGTSTTVSYTAAGPAGSPAPASQACVIKPASDGQPIHWRPVHWRPVQSTVTQRVTGTGGWLETGTLVFRLPPGRPDYFTGDCTGAVEDASSGSELGVRLP